VPRREHVRVRVEQLGKETRLGTTEIRIGPLGLLDKQLALALSLKGGFT
jgi:hypothetical protein